MHTQGGKTDEFAEWKLGKDEEEKLLDRFRDPLDPLKFLIVTSSSSRASTPRSSRPCTLTSPCATTAYCRPSAAPTACIREGPRPDRRLPGRLRRRLLALDFDEVSVKKVITNL